MAEKPDYDQRLKRLLSEAHDGFLQLIAPGAIWREELPEELPAPGRRADLVWRIEQPNGKPAILHVELQTKAEADIGERMADYILRLFRHHHIEIFSLLIFLRPTRALPPPVFTLRHEEDQKDYLWASYDILRLWDVPARRVLEIGQYQLWPLSALMADSSIESILEMGDRIAHAPIPHSERAELAGLLFSLGGLRHKKPSLTQALRRKRMLEELLEESEVTQEFRKRGLEEGKAAGRAEGRAEGERQAILTVLTARYGAVSEDLRAALDGARVEDLPALIATAATEPLERVRARLGLS